MVQEQPSEATPVGAWSQQTPQRLQLRPMRMMEARKGSLPEEAARAQAMPLAALIVGMCALPATPMAVIVMRWWAKRVATPRRARVAHTVAVMSRPVRLAASPAQTSMSMAPVSPFVAVRVTTASAALVCAGTFHVAAPRMSTGP
jgi:hypothetical protein